MNPSAGGDYTRPPRPVYPPVRPHQPDHNDIQKYTVALGDNSKMSCEIGNHDRRTSWRRLDGRPLPRNTYLSGGDLNFQYVEEDAAGIYECVVHEPHGDYPVIKTELVVVGKFEILFVSHLHVLCKFS